MDILAAMLAYLGCVTGIVGALAISFYVYIAPPGQTAAGMQTAAVAVKANDGKTGAPKSTALTHLKPITTIAQRTQDAAAAVPVAADVRQKGQLSHAALRRLAQEQRAKRWAYQQDSSFESRFLSYAD
ncbi:MAG: hypothetical protein WAL80_12025 [Xanthobacteraceae bacterium]|jgi:hypothetical protein